MACHQLSKQLPKCLSYRDALGAFFPCCSQEDMAHFLKPNFSFTNFSHKNKFGPFLFNFWRVILLTERHDTKPLYMRLFPHLYSA